MTAGMGRTRIIARPGYMPPVGVFAAQAGLLIDGPNDRLGYKFYAPTASPVASVAINLSVTGSTTGITLVAAIQADSSDAPSGTDLGTATAATAAPAAAGYWTAALVADTGALTVGAPYWLVLRDGGGTNPTGSNLVQARSLGAVHYAGEKIRAYNGSDWTTISSAAVAGLITLTFADGTSVGHIVTAARTNSGQTDIFGTNRQGFKFTYGANVTPHGVMFRLTKTGSPSALVCEVYEDSTLRCTGTLAAADIATDTNQALFFSTRAEVAAASVMTISFKQAADGGDNSNDYDLLGYPISATYIASMLPTGERSVSGTANPPVTTLDTFFPNLGLLIDDPATDFDSPEAPEAETVYVPMILE